MGRRPTAFWLVVVVTVLSGLALAPAPVPVPASALAPVLAVARALGPSPSLAPVLGPVLSLLLPLPGLRPPVAEAGGRSAVPVPIGVGAVRAGPGIAGAVSGSTSECTSIDFGAVKPSLSPYVAPMAFQATVAPSENPVEVSISGSDLVEVNPSGEPRTIPSTRVSWRRSWTEEGEWAPLSPTPAPVMTIPAATTASICLDFKYDVLWEDPAGSFSGTVTLSFAPHSSAVLSKAVPNPFSPNGDGRKDTTTIACDVNWDPDPEATIVGRIEQGGGQDLVVLKEFLCTTVQDPGTVRGTWDGTRTGGGVVEDGLYRYAFYVVEGSGAPREFASGAVQVDSTAPVLEVSSPQDGSQVETNLVVTGTTSSPEDLVSVFVGDVVLAQARPAADGTFSVRVRVPPGQSELTVLSEDLAGNRASCTVTVINNSAVVILAPSYAATQSPVVEFRGRGPVLAMVSLAVNGRPAGSTKASATGDWVVRGVALSPGDNIVTASATNQRGEVVATEKPVVVHFRPTSGTALITGRVSDARTGGAVAGAEVSLVAGGATIGTVRTSADGRYELKDVPSGTWRLRAVALNYVAQETGDITLGAGETRTVDFALVPNRALVVRKSVSTSTSTTGDIVGYAITVENLTDGIVRDVRVVDLLPPGVAVIDGTSEVQSVPCEPDMVAPREATWAIGDLGPRESATVRFRAAVGFDAAAGKVTNAACAMGSTDLGPVKTPLAEATMHVSKGVFSDDGTVFGRVFLDLDGDGTLGPDDFVLAGAAIVTEDGTEVATDACGLYSLKGVRPGLHTIVLREDSLPVNFECPRKARLVDVGLRALVRLDFPVVVANGYLNGNGNGYWNGYGNGNGNENPGGNGVPSGNGKVNGNGVLNGNGKSNGIGNGNSNGNSIANGIGNGKANGNGTRAAIAKTYGKEPLVLVALGEAVISSATFSGNVEEAQAVERDGARTLDGNLAFFLRGWIKGKYLLTAGFDLGRHFDGRGAYLNPDAYYPVYGDMTQVTRSLPYAGPLYVGIEWDGWKATWSTFRTDFMESDLASYVRTLPGGLVTYEGNHIKAAVFDSVTTQVAARDEFAADGTSGPFKLTHTRVIGETERVQVMTRSASGVEVASRVLRRDVDYDIDYTAGSILLAAPLPKEDGAGNLNFLVVSYEYEPVATDIASHVQGAAASAWVTPRLRLGAGIVKHAASPALLLLYNVHGEYLITQKLSVYGEVAGSSAGAAPAASAAAVDDRKGADEAAGAGNGRALSLRCSGEVGPVTVRARYRAIGPGFTSPTAQLKDDVSELTLKASADIAPGLRLSGEATEVRDNVSGSREGSPTSDRSWGVGASYVLHGLGSVEARVRGRAVVDETSGGEAVNRTESSWGLGLTRPLGDMEGIAVAGASIGVGYDSVRKEDAVEGKGSTDSSVYLRAGGRVLDSVDTSVTLRFGSWADLATGEAVARYSALQASAEGAVAEGLKLSVSYSTKLETRLPDETQARSGGASARIEWAASSSFRSYAGVGTSSSGDGAAVSVGASYKPADLFEAYLRYEKSLEKDKTLLSLGATGRPIQGLELSARYGREANGTASALSYEVGFAWRPLMGDRLVLFGGTVAKQAEGNRLPGNFTRTQTNHLGLSLAVDPLTDVSGRYAWKMVAQRNGLPEVSVETSLASVRITRKLGAEFDVAGEYTTYFTDVAERRRTEAAVEVGFLPRETLRLAVGYRWTRSDCGGLRGGAWGASHIYLRLGYSWVTGL